MLGLDNPINKEQEIQLLDLIMKQYGLRNQFKDL